MRANAIAADADGATRKAHLMTCSKLAGARWRGMSEMDKRTYKRRAKAHIIVDDNAKKAAVEEGTASSVEVDNFPSSRRTTGFHVFRSEYFQRWKRDNPDAGAVDRKLSMIISCKEAGAHWKDLSEAEKSTYNERAAMENRCGIPRDDIDIRNFTSSSEELHRGGQANANPYVKIRCMDRSGIPKVLDAYLDSSKKRLESSADYFSPFREQDVGYGFQAGEGVREAASEEEFGADQVRVIDSASKANISSESIPEGVDGPMGYGNCLLAIHCQCQHCNSRSPASFIFHPAGDNLSSLAMSKVSFPRSSPCRDGHQRQEVDIGGRILQISRCGAKRTMESSNGFCIVVRTFQYCSVIYAKSTMTTLVVEEECPIEYHMREETRIDLRTTPCRSLTPSYLPVYLSCDPNATDSFFTFPTFAILSRDSAGSSTTIHRVVLRREPVVIGHSLSSSLSDISLIEFCSDSGMAVWAAARSRVMPKLSLGFFKGRSGTVTGYGHSLFRIDLRDDSSSLVWSPSHAEFLTEGIHSINGIMSDATMEHVVWVSSSSACKVWALDVRHKLAKVVVSWSLPLLSDDFGSQSSLTGIYGGGVIMSQPVSSCSFSDNKRVCSIQDIQPPAMFGLKKDLNSNSLCMFQFPCAMPRFGTQPLESAGFQYIPRTNYDASSIARSSIFPLPDAAGSIFNVGLTSFHYSSRTCLSPKQLDQLCYQTTPGSVIYVITMTSIGDLYCHSLLETNGAEETLARQFTGLPVGTKAIPVPGDVETNTPNRGCLSVSLTNEFPIPSNAITPFIVREARDCCQYKSYDIGDILSQKLQTEKSPLAAHDSVDSNRATKEVAFDCYSSNDNVKSYRLAHYGLHESEGKSNSSVNIRYSLSHFPPKFGVVVSSELPEQSSQVGDHLAAATGCHPQPISLPFSQTVVIISNKDQGAMEYDSGDDLDRVINASDKRKSNEIDLGLIRALKSGYYLNEKADIDQQIGVKCEWSSDSE
ncbi:hypothetical protein ACHAW5_004002 [Stephanodiscus triporus]|uniref:HMG box domain-containing protein n=1 Tax=Stephanodiscus triporus TaxID=2934178 RepID=A0ABD3PH42_9STRA